MGPRSALSRRGSRELSQGVQPWSYAPHVAKPKRLVFHSWKWVERYDKYLPQWDKEGWGIPLQPEINPPGPAQFEKVDQRFGAGEQLEVMTSLLTDRAGFLKAGILRPINDMPGVDDYVKDFHDFARDSLMVDGKIWGLPCLVETWVPNSTDSPCYLLLPPFTAPGIPNPPIITGAWKAIWRPYVQLYEERFERRYRFWPMA